MDRGVFVVPGARMILGIADRMGGRSDRRAFWGYTPATHTRRRIKYRSDSRSEPPSPAVNTIGNRGLAKSDKAQQGEHGDPAAKRGHDEDLLHSCHVRLLCSVVERTDTTGVPIRAPRGAKPLWDATTAIAITSRTRRYVDPQQHDARKQRAESTQISKKPHRGFQDAHTR